MPPAPFPRRALIEELEPRLLFSADFAPGVADALAPQSESRVLDASGEFSNTTDSQQQAQHARLEVVFIDLRVQGYDKILADIREQNAGGHSIEVVLLDAERDGVAQIGEFLGQRQDIDAVHLISHGRAGSVQLGSGELNFETLLGNATEIRQWGNALSNDADILIYGCDVAGTDEGQSLINALSRLTGADVAASDDLTGNTAQGGDWALEYHSGDIQASVPVGAYARENWTGVLAVDDSYSGNEDGGAISGNVLSNDGGATTATLVAGPANGALALNADGSFSYTPNANFNGTNSFEYLATSAGTGLTNYWGLEGNGTDIIGGSNGTLMNGPTTVSGHDGNALQFDGVNDYVVLPDVTYTNNFTLSFYFKIADNSGTGMQYFYSHGSIPSTNQPNTIQVGVGETGFTSPNQLITTVWDSNETSGQSYVDISSLIGDGQWHLYTLTATSGTGTRIYVDGTLQDSIATGGDAINPTGNAYVGARSDLNATRFLNAGSSMDSVSIYNRALSAAEITGLAASSPQATATLTVNSVNDAPAGTNKTVTTPEDTAYTFTTADFGFSDTSDSPANSLLAVRITTLPGAGSLTLNGVAVTAGQFVSAANISSGLLKFSPAANANGSSYDSFTFQVQDNGGTANGGVDLAPSANTITINVTAVNDPPVAVNDSYSIDEDTSLVISPSTSNLANWWKMDDGGSSQTVTDHGSQAQNATLGSTTSIETTDPAWSTGYVGSAGLSLDGSSDYLTTTSTLAKTASNFTLSTWFQADTTIGPHLILWQGYSGGNGFGEPPGTSAQAEMNLSVGTNTQDNKIAFFMGYDLPVNGADSIYIVSASDFTDTTQWHHVAVTVADQGGGIMQAWLYVDGVLQGTDTGSQNDRTAWGAMQIGKPGADTRYFDGKIDEVRIYDTALSQSEVQSITNVGVLGNDTDADNSRLSVNTSVVTGPSNGTLNINADGSFSYTPNANFNGVDSFTYKANDGTVDSNLATVTITVNPVDDPVVIGGDTTGSGNEDGGPITGILTAVDAADGLTDGTIFSVSGAAGFGVASIDAASGAWSYTPAADFNGSDSFTVTVTDDDGHTATQLVSITVNPVNDAPAITSNGAGDNATIALVENTGTVTTVTSTDVDGGAPVYSISGGDSAQFTINPTTGALSFITAPDFENPTDVGADNVYNLTVQVSDGAGGTDTQAIAVTVTNVADGIRITPISVVPIGSETLVNTNTADIQNINPNVAQAIASDANGNFVIVWASNLQDGSAYGIYAQRYSADGTPQGAEFLVNTTTADNQLNPVVAMDAAGNFVVSWSSNLQDGSGYGVYAQRFNAAGVAQGSEFLVNTTTAGGQTGPALAISSSGAFVIAWTGSGQDPDASAGIYAQRFDASGVAQGGEFRVNTYTTDTQQLTSASMDSAGNFVVTWASNLQDGSNYGVYGQRFDAAGVAQGSEFRVNTTTANSQLYHDVAMLPDGRFVVAFQSRNADGSFEVFMQRYAADGSMVGGETQVNATTVSSAQQPIASVSADADGNIIVVWNNAADGSGVGAVGRRFDWSGTALGGEFQVSTTTAGNQLYPDVVVQPDGGFIVAWSGNGSGDADGVFMQRYGLTTTEGGGTATFSVVLEKAPTADVVIPISVPDASEGTVSVGSLTFTTANWNIAQTVTVTGVQDYTNDGTQTYQVVIGAATSTDANFNGLNPADLTVTNREIPNVSPVNSIPGPQSVNEDATLVFSSANGNAISISDADAGTNIVNVLLTASNGTITLNGTTGLSFITGDGTADALLNFTGTIASINAALNGLSFAPSANYNGPASLQIITGDMGNSGTGGALSDSDTVSITVNPVDDPVVIGGDTTGSGNEDGGPITGILTAVDAADGLTDGSVFSVTGAASFGVASIDAASGAWSYTPAADFNGSDSFTVTVTDDDGHTATQVISLTVNPVDDITDDSLTTNEDTPITANVITGTNGASADSFEGAPVLIGVTQGANGTVSFDAAGNVTYTPDADWNGSDSFTYTVSSGGLNETATVNVTVNPDNDAPVIAANSLTLIEGETVVLDNTNLNANDLEQGPAQLTYSVSNVVHGQFEWAAVPGTAIASFTQADIDAGLVVFVHDASDFAPSYDVTVDDGITSTGPQPATISFTPVSEGINVSALSGTTTSETGTFITFDVALNSQPFTDVSVVIVSGSPTEGSASVASLTFTSANWNVAQQVTVTGEDDFVDDGDQDYLIGLQAASADRNYDALAAPDVALVNQDDDTAGITLSPTSGLVTDEAGASDSFSVVLTSEPLADVSINLSSSNPAEGVLSASSLTFSPGNWNIPQIVTVSGVDDSLEDGDVAYQALAAPAASADPLYNGMAGGSVDILNLNVAHPVLIEPPVVVEPVLPPDGDAGAPEAPELDLPEVSAPLPPMKGFEIGSEDNATVDDALDDNLNPLQTTLFNKEFRSRETLTNPDTQGNAFLRLLEIIRAEYVMGDTDQIRIAPAIQIEIARDEAFKVEIFRQGAEITAVSLSIGAVWWALRAGGLFTSLISSLPAWGSFDVLPVLSRNEDGDEDEKDPWGLDEDTGDEEKKSKPNEELTP